MILILLFLSWVSHFANEATAIESMASLDLSKKFVESTLGPKTILNGPNCFNLALYTHGAINSIRFTNDKEAQALFESQFCKVLDHPREGAIGVVSVLNLNLALHAYIWLGDNSVLTKNGTFSRYQHQSMSEMNDYIDYLASVECHRRGDEQCAQEVVYFDCTGANISSVVKLDDSIQPTVRELYEVIDNWEAAISDLVLNGSLNEHQGFQHLDEQQLKAHVDSVVGWLESQQEIQEEFELLHILRQRMISLRLQLVNAKREIDDQSLFDKLHDSLFRASMRLRVTDPSNNPHLN